MRSSFTPVIAALLATLLIGAPVAANPPERSQDPWFGEFYDPATNTFVLANITGEAWCDWALGGFAGEPDLIAPTDVMAVSRRSGATVYRFHARWQLEAYSYPTVAESPEEECALMAEHGIWATGHVTITYTDNDVDIVGPGANSFGWSMNGSLTDADGSTYRFKRIFRAQFIGGEFFLRVNDLSIR